MSAIRSLLGASGHGKFVSARTSFQQPEAPPKILRQAAYTSARSRTGMPRAVLFAAMHRIPYYGPASGGANAGHTYPVFACGLRDRTAAAAMAPRRRPHREGPSA